MKTVIVDEIHALARDKRGSHLSLSLERLEALVLEPLLESPIVTGRASSGSGSRRRKSRSAKSAVFWSARARVRTGRRRPSPADGCRDRGSALAAFDRLLARAMGRNLQSNRDD